MLIISVGIVLSGMIFATAPAYAVPKKEVEEGTYIFYSKLGNNMVLDIDNASKDSGANLQLWGFNNTLAQQFEVKKSGSYYIITAKCSGMALDVSGGSADSGANVQQYTPNNTDAQKWLFYDAGDGYYYLRCKVGYNALDVYGGYKENGTNIQMYPPNATDAQKWKLKRVSASSATNPTTSSKEQSMSSKLTKMMEGDSYSGAYKLNKRYTGQFYNEQCKGFAKSVHMKLFGYNIGSTKSKPNNYLINIDSSKTKFIGSIKNMNSKNATDDKVKALFSKARPGDFVQMRRTHTGSHSAIVYSVSSTGITFYEANTDGQNH